MDSAINRSVVIECWLLEIAERVIEEDRWREGYPPHSQVVCYEDVSGTESFVNAACVRVDLEQVDVMIDKEHERVQTGYM